MIDDSGSANTPDDETTFQYDFDVTRDPSTAIVEGIAAATNREPTELPPIHEYVDPSALDALVTSAADSDGDPVTVSFVYDDIDIRVTSVGTITITLHSDET